MRKAYTRNTCTGKAGYDVVLRRFPTIITLCGTALHDRARAGGGSEETRTRVFVCRSTRLQPSGAFYQKRSDLEQQTQNARDAKLWRCWGRGVV